MAYTQNPLTFEVKNLAGKISQRQLDIINAAGKLITTQGSSGLTVKNIAKLMKFSEAALYRHYSSKEAIIVSLLDFVANELDTLFNDLDKTKTPKDRFLDYNQCQYDYFKRKPYFVAATFSDGIFDSTEKINHSLNGVNTVLQKHLIPIIMDGKLDKTYPMEIHSEKIVHILLATNKFHLSKWHSSKYSSDLEKTGMDMAQTMLQIFS